MAIQIKKSTLKKNKKAAPNGVAHIQSTFNNTIVTITNVNGETISWASAGAIGFKGAKKGTPFAAQIGVEISVPLIASITYVPAVIGNAVAQVFWAKFVCIPNTNTTIKVIFFIFLIYYYGQLDNELM